ncbi:vacuolar protein, partial [Perkinsus olseni]
TSDNSVVIAGGFGCTQFLDPSEVHVVVQRHPLHVKVAVASALCLRLTPACLRFVNGTLATVRGLVKEIVGSMKDMRKGIREAVQKARQLQPPASATMPSMPDFGLDLALDTARLEVCADGQADGLVVEVNKVSLTLADSEWKGACAAFLVHADGNEDEAFGGCIRLQGESSSAIELQYKGRRLEIQSGYLLSDITPGFLRTVAEVSRELSAEVEGVSPDDARETTKTVMEASDALFSDGGEVGSPAPEVEMERVKLGLLEFARRNGGKLEIPKMEGEESLVEVTVGSRGSCLSLFDSDNTKDRTKAIVVGRIADMRGSVAVSRGIQKKLVASGELTVRSISLEVSEKEIIAPSMQPASAKEAAPFVSVLWGLYPTPWPYQSAVIAQAQQLRIRPLLVDVKAVKKLAGVYRGATKVDKAPPVEHFIDRIDDLGAAIAESTEVARLPCLIAVRAAAPVLELAVSEKKNEDPHGGSTDAVDLMDLDAQEQSSSEESYEYGDHMLVNLGVVTLDSKLEDTSTVRIDTSVKDVYVSAFSLPPPPRSPVRSDGEQSEEDLLIGSEQETDAEASLTEEVILPAGSATLSISLPLSWEKVGDEEDFSKLVAIDASVQDKVLVKISPAALGVVREIGQAVRAAYRDSEIADSAVADEGRVLTGLHKLATKRQRTDVELRASLGEISFCLVTHEGAHPLEVSAKSLALTTSRSSMKAELAIGQATAKVANYTFINLSTGEDEGAGLTTTLSLADSPA